MFSPVSINEEMTLATFGYSSTEFPSGSHKKIVVECVSCRKLIHRERRNSDKVHQCPVVDGNNKRCFKCHEWKDTSFFNKCPKQSGGVAKLCRACYNSHPAVKRCESMRNKRLSDALAFGDIEFYIRRRALSIRYSAKTKGVDCNIDADYLLELWNEQAGKCFYSNIPMKGTGRDKGFQSWDGPSLDRRNPSKGYIRDNVVWCIFAVNSFKQSMSENEFLELVHSIEWKPL
jgi:hypothetical protein